MWNEKCLVYMLCEFPRSGVPSPQRQGPGAGLHEVFACHLPLPEALLTVTIYSQRHLVGICGLPFPFSRLENPTPISAGKRTQGPQTSSLALRKMPFWKDVFAHDHLKGKKPI